MASLYGMSKAGRRWFLAAAFFVLAALSAPAIAADPTTLEIISKNGVHVFKVELAVTAEERARGLMDRHELPDGRGMLFDFKQDQVVGFWMRNTYIPLDMIFIRSDGRIMHIAENTKPLSEENISSRVPVRGVLEVIGGTARKLGVAVGDKVAHPFFSGR